MTDNQSAVRLVYPQWQGASIVPLVPEIKDPAEASTGYYLGAQLLNFLAPDNGQKTLTVPVSTDTAERKVVDGVFDRDVIVKQNRAALDLLRENDPAKLVVLGGECAVSVVPFTYLAEKYPGDVAMVWIDAHPDITLPGDVYAGFHAMAVTAIMGKGDPQIIAGLPAKIEADKILMVGLRNWERDEIRRRQKEYGIRHLSKEDLIQNKNALKDWLNTCGASKAVVHFDMDVLDPAEIVAAVGTDPDGMKIDEVVALINDVAAEKEIVGLTVAEPMPRTAIRLKNMLARLPLLKK